jgi:hypothetical protein
VKVRSSRVGSLPGENGREIARTDCVKKA